MEDTTLASVTSVAAGERSWLPDAEKTSMSPMLAQKPPESSSSSSPPHGKSLMALTRDLAAWAAFPQQNS
eukprot:scaffold1486_cov329-Prasinococcus_capsulatus_cf.AAC.13